MCVCVCMKEKNVGLNKLYKLIYIFSSIVTITVNPLNRGVYATIGRFIIVKLAVMCLSVILLACDDSSVLKDL